MAETDNSGGFELLVKAIANDGRSIQKVYIIQFTTKKSTTRLTLSSDKNNLPTILSSNDNETNESLEKFHLTQESLSTSNFSDFTKTSNRFMLSGESGEKTDPPQFEKLEYQFLIENPQKDDLIGTLGLIKFSAEPVHMLIEPSDYAIWFRIDPRVFFSFFN